MPIVITYPEDANRRIYYSRYLICLLKIYHMCVNILHTFCLECSGRSEKCKVQVLFSVHWLESTTNIMAIRGHLSFSADSERNREIPSLGVLGSCMFACASLLCDDRLP